MSYSYEVSASHEIGGSAYRYHNYSRGKMELKGQKRSLKIENKQGKKR
jgi:hypothetical protein